MKPRPGKRIQHHKLGECQVTKVHDDGSLSVVSANVYGNCNTWRIRAGEDPYYWQWKAERVC